MIVQHSRWLLVVVVALGAAFASDSLAKPPAPVRVSANVSGTSHSAGIASIARQVRKIERQAGHYRRLELPPGEIGELLGCCTCTDARWTAYLQKGSLRKAGVYTGEGRMVELYFDRGRLIFVLATDEEGEESPHVVKWWERYYLKNGRLIRAATNRPLKDRRDLMSQETLRQCERAILTRVRGK